MSQSATGGWGALNSANQRQSDHKSGFSQFQRISPQSPELLQRNSARDEGLLRARARLFYVSTGRSGVTVKACMRHLRVEMSRVKYWGIAHDLSAKCARTLLPSLNVLNKNPTRSKHTQKLCIYEEVFFFSRNYLWVAVLRQDLQHRRFSALNVSNKNQFASHHQRLRISSFLHGFIAGLGSPFSRFHRKYHSKPAQKWGGGGRKKKPVACVMDGAPRRMRAVDLIEFATAALYTSAGQPMRAHTLHRLLLLLHPATTTATLVCPQQGSRRDVSASQKKTR